MIYKSFCWYAGPIFNVQSMSVSARKEPERIATFPEPNPVKSLQDNGTYQGRRVLRRCYARVRSNKKGRAYDLVLYLEQCRTSTQPTASLHEDTFIKGSLVRQKEV